jgi:hypothetical protein
MIGAAEAINKRHKKSLEIIFQKEIISFDRPNSGSKLKNSTERQCRPKAFIFSILFKKFDNYQ